MKMPYQLMISLVLLPCSSLSYSFPPKFRRLNNIFHMVVPVLDTPTTFRLSENFEVKDFITRFSNQSSTITGVYAVTNGEQKVQYIGISRDVVSSLTILSKSAPVDVSFTRVNSFSTSDFDAMFAYRDELLRNLADPINQKNPLWLKILQESGVDTLEVSKDEVLAESLPSKVADRQRLKNLIKSTQEAIPETASPNGKEIVSPFITETAPQKSVPAMTYQGSLELNMENVDKVLDEVRPYLIADGGNVAVLSVDSSLGEVRLKLQGACGSCPSSTTTMKMGIERVLKENFPQFRSVVAVDQPDSSVQPPETALTRTVVENALTPVLPALKAMGGSVEVDEVDGASGKVCLRFKGPVKLRQGVIMIIKELQGVQAIEVTEVK